MSTIGARIKEQRTKIGITQQELADKLELSLEMVRSMENNRKKPSVETLTKLSDLFNCSTDYLLCKIDNEVPNLIDFVNLVKNHPNSSLPDDLITLLETIKIPDEAVDNVIKLLRHIAYLQEEGGKIREDLTELEKENKGTV